MPELPEVEVVRRGLAGQLLGKRICRVEVFHPRTLRGENREAFVRQATGWQVQAVVRRGKFLWLLGGPAVQADSGLNVHPGDRLGKMADKTGVSQQAIGARSEVGTKNTPSQDAATNKTVLGTGSLALVIHLGMSGQCLVNSGQVGLDQKTTRHLRVRLDFEDNWSLNFIDQRTFGRMRWDKLVETADGKPAGCGADAPLIPQMLQGKIGRDPLDPFLEVDFYAKRWQKLKRPVKNLLLDQSFISGIGNIYADEALFLAGIHPLKTPTEIGMEALEQLYAAAGSVMRRALAVGGTSFDALYVNTAGDPGYFARSLQVYGRKGQECKRCATRLEQIKIAGRSATYCPVCQPGQ